MKRVGQKLEMPAPDLLEFISNPKKALNEEETRIKAKPPKVTIGKRRYSPEES